MRTTETTHGETYNHCSKILIPARYVYGNIYSTGTSFEVDTKRTTTAAKQQARLPQLQESRRTDSGTGPIYAESTYLGLGDLLPESLALDCGNLELKGGGLTGTISGSVGAGTPWRTYVWRQDHHYVSNAKQGRTQSEQG